MKKLKFIFLSLFVMLFVLSSCTNEESVTDQNEQQTEESESITNALNQLSTEFDSNGNVTTESSDAGNIVLDFCFDFVYPITLSYNNGSVVTVNDLDGLVDVMINSTQDLYINGISFPFNVETFNEDTNTIEVGTIEDEAQFIDLLVNCEFDNVEECVCTAEVDPVCVEITDPNGGTFTVTYSNACWAACDGFSEEDFIDDCTDDYYASGFECFSLNFPVTIITENGEQITVNSEEELNTALYDVYVFDFVYPITVTTDEQEVITIDSQDDLQDLLDDCYGYYDEEPDDCEECQNAPFEPVCVEITTPTGEVFVEAFPNACFAECLGYTEANFIDCGNNNEPQECSIENVETNLSECEWYAYTSVLGPQQDLVFNFNNDGSLTAEYDNVSLTGSWEITNNPNQPLIMSFTLPDALDNISQLEWAVLECSDEHLFLVSQGQVLTLERDCD